MKDKQRKYAVKLFQKTIKEYPDYTEEEFVKDVETHLMSLPLTPNNYFDPYSLWSALHELWRALNMSMRDVVEYSGLKMSKFATRYCIPYRTLQAWCDGTNPCPIYIKIMLCELLGLIRKTDR